MTALAAQTNATKPRLSHVVRRLEDRDLVERFPCAEDARANNARLTKVGRATFMRRRPAMSPTSGASPENTKAFRAVARYPVE